METPLFDILLSKNDLIEYVINKKVSELQKKCDDITNERNKFNEASNKVNGDLEEKRIKVLTEAVKKHIKEKLSSLISTFEKSYSDVETIIILPNDKKNDNIKYQLRIAYLDGVILFKHKKQQTLPRRREGSRQHPIYDEVPLGYDDLFSMVGYLIIKQSVVSQDKKLLDITLKQKAIQNKKEEFNTQINNLCEEIRKIKNKREDIKNLIVEQILNETEEGKNMLAKLQNFKFSDFKLLG